MDQLSRAALVVLSPFVIRAVWHASGTILRRFFTKKMTVIYDLPNVGQARSDGKRIKGSAVICGGSIAGLWSARVCADHFENVVIVEPESWLESPEGRSPIYDENGVLDESQRTHSRTLVAQYDAAHVFQPLSYQALKHVFPNFDEEIKKTDGRVMETELNVHIYGGQIMRLPKDDYPDGNCPKNFFASRETYERLLRRLVLESSSRIRWVTGTATNVRSKGNDPTTLADVIVRTSNSQESVIPAALVVDCTGGSQVGLKWLKRLSAEAEAPLPGGSAPFDNLRIEYNTGPKYKSYRFYVPPEVRETLPIPGGYENVGWIYTFMPDIGVEQKYFVISRLEGHRIEFAFGGWGNPPVPTDFSEIKDYFRNLGGNDPVPESLYSLLDTLLEYKHLATSVSSKIPSFSWIRYERAASVPSNFVAIGDSVMRVNPTFGQGCTKACLGTITLDAVLRSSFVNESDRIPAGFGGKFFKAHADKIAGAWDGTKPTDYQWATTIPVKGEELSDERYSAEFSKIIMRLAAHDKKVDSALWHVRCFLAPPTDLLHPFVLFKAGLFWLRETLRAPS